MGLYSRKIFHLLTIIVLFFWISLSSISSNQCTNIYFFGFLHWDVCENMGTLTNALYVIFQILTVLISGYLIVVGIMFFNSRNDI